jgi:hypothetical protein
MIQEYTTQKTLNPKLWSNGKLRKKLRAGFLKIANEFYKFLDVDAPVKDIIIIGSSANYNWTEHSDIDLHVVINYGQVGDNLHLVKNYMHAKKSIWNENYPLSLKGMNIELYAQDVNEKLHSTVASYSLMQNKWLTKPTADMISIDDAIIQQKAEPYEYEIDSLKASDPHIEKKIQSIKNRLRHLRQTGLDAEGEYSIENMAYKHLRNRGYLERLKRLEQKITMGRLSVENAVNEFNVPGMIDKGKSQVKDFMSAMKNETLETKHALKMILDHINGEKLTPEEWKWVRGQMKDVVKLLGLTTVAVTPGGSLIAILAKALKVDKYMLPSSFKKTDEKEVTESLIMHVTRKKPLDTSGWESIMKKTDAVETPQGQWEHPGRCTMIPSNSITMRNVAYPVLGIDDTGHMQMMQPEQQYKYPGNRVFEIPHTAQWQTMIMQLQNAMKNGTRYAK